MAIPAEPILASVLWEAGRAKGKGKSASRAPGARTPPKTDIRVVDEALSGCIQYGGVTCIHGEDGSGGTELCEATLTSHLLNDPSFIATVIDIGSTFDLRHIHQSVLSRMRAVSDPNQAALQVLERLHIMKIFDFEGLVDAVAEIRQSAQHGNHSSAPQKASPKPPRGTVGDSESEEELSNTPSPQIVSPAAPSDSATSSRLLLINNLHQVISPLIKSNHVQGQALLISFTRSLQLLTKAHNLCTIIVSGTTSYTKWKEESPSAFGSCTLRPVLGPAFSHLLDSELMVHQSVVPGPKQGGGKDVSVVEVLQNRHGKGIGRWAPFAVDEGGISRAYG